MSIAIDGQIYNGWYTDCNGITINDAIDCGLGYTSYELENGIPKTIVPKSIAELVTPTYYYTDTSWLSSIGFNTYVNMLLGTDKLGKERLAKVLIRSRDNFAKFPSTLTTPYIKRLYLLAQTQIPSISGTAFLDDIYKQLNGTEIIPLNISDLQRIKFYDISGKEVPVSNISTTLASQVDHATYNYHGEYPLAFYTRDRYIADIYIGNYHVILGYEPSARYYISACKAEDFCYKFLTMVETEMFFFDSADSYTSKLFNLTFNSSAGHKTLRLTERNNNLYDYSYFSIYNKDYAYTGKTFTSGKALNPDHNIYTNVGLPPDDTIGVLPLGTDLNSVGQLNGYTSLTSLESDGLKYMSFPLGTYYLSPSPTNDYSTYKNVPATSITDAKPLSITASSIDGTNVMQEFVYIGAATYKRYFYYTDSSNTWTSWSQRKWN